MKYERNCNYCGTYYKGRGKNFCSKECSHKSKIGKTKLPPKICDNCKGEYSGKSRRNARFCSPECFKDYKSKNPEEYPNSNLGRKQTQEQVDRRIKNTDQKKKQEKRNATMVERYGVSNWSETEQGRKRLSEVHSGKPRPRDKDHQIKIIESKRENGTLKHRQETKDKISKGVNEYLQRDDVDFSYMVSSRNNTYVHGYYLDMYYRSSYELMFLKFCDEYNIKVESAENKKHYVTYFDPSGKKRRYFPDFYLPDFEITVEIKPISMLDVGDNPLRINAGLTQIENYIILTEADGLTSEAAWDTMYLENFAYLEES